MISIRNYKKIVVSGWVVAVLIMVSEASYAAERRLLGMIADKENALKQTLTELNASQVITEQTKQALIQMQAEAEKMKERTRHVAEELQEKTKIIEKTEAQLASSFPMLPLPDQIDRVARKLSINSDSMSDAARKLNAAFGDAPGKDAVERATHLQGSRKQIIEVLGKSQEEVDPLERAKAFTKRLKKNAKNLTEAYHAVKQRVDQVGVDGEDLETQIQNLAEEVERLRLCAKQKKDIEKENDVLKEKSEKTTDSLTVLQQKLSITKDLAKIQSNALEQLKNKRRATDKVTTDLQNKIEDKTQALSQVYELSRVQNEHLQSEKDKVQVVGEVAGFLQRELEDKTQTLSQISQAYQLSEEQNSRLKLVVNDCTNVMSMLKRQLDQKEHDLHYIHESLRSIKGMSSVLDNWMENLISSPPSEVNNS